MRRRMVAGNWKMHGSRQFVAEYLRELAAGLAQADVAGIDLLLLPPVGYLALAADLLAAADLDERVALGAQNLHHEASGAYTGEMAGEMLRDLGARYVLAGHSERRQYAAETDEHVAAKVAAALRADLTPILCIGETAAERERGETEAVVMRQLGAVTRQIADLAPGQLLVAYEPVWAIGTGQTATPDTAQAVHALIRSELEVISAELAAQTPILYGGSVKGANAAELFAEQDIDGGLVGGASLEADELLTIAGCF